jgi:hypothetical protein
VRYSAPIENAAPTRPTEHDPFWSRPRVLRALTATIFVGLVAFQVWWWHDHGGPISWVLVVATPLVSVVPAGVIVSVRRRSWVTAWARDHGFTHEAHPPWPIPTWDFPPFSTGRARRRRITDGMRGQVGAFPAYYFHYTWWNDNKVQFTSHQRNVFVLTLPAALPRLTVGANLDRSPGDLVHVESAEFDRKFAVQCHDARFAHAVFPPRTIDALVTRTARSPVIAFTKFEIIGDLMVGVSMRGSRPGDITDIFDVMHTIVAGIPHFIWVDHGSSPPREEYR